MKDRLLFIQFMHPGKEHEPDSNQIKDWNTGDHKRKFIRNPGAYLDYNNCKRYSQLVFWCEWEPQSEVFDKISEPDKGYPRFIYSPYWTQPITYEYLDTQRQKFYQNTDPFVFETPFKYALCQQKAKMKHLAQGSVILFGSQVDKKHFCLDTVFVVSGWIEYSNLTYEQDLKAKVSEDYLAITMKPAWEKNKNIGKESFRLYFGASYETPVGGMFSFFPCLPFEQETKGFQKPIIQISDVVDGKPIIAGTQNTGKRYTEFSDLQAIKPYWDKVAQQVIQKSLYLGVATDLPEKR